MYIPCIKVARLTVSICNGRRYSNIYIADFSQSFSSTRMRSEAEEIASQIKPDGERIYKMSLQEWKEKLQWHGEHIYDSLQPSDETFSPALFKGNCRAFFLVF